MDTHCQLMTDFKSLKIDYGSDNSIAEFPSAPLWLINLGWPRLANVTPLGVVREGRLVSFGWHLRPKSSPKSHGAEEDV